MCCIDHPVTADRSDTLVEKIAVAHECEAVSTIEETACLDALLPFEGHIEIMALFGFQLRIANQHNTHVAHVVMHIHLLERRCTKPTGIIGSECEPREFIDPGQTFRESVLGGSRKIVIAHTRHHIETVVDVPVELNIAVDVVLRMGCIVTKLIGGEIVMQDISSHQEVVSAQRVTVEGMRHMLPVTVVVVVRTGTVGQIVCLIILVVRIR